MKVTRKSDGAVIYKDEKGQNLTAGYGHYFLFGIGLTNSGETLKMEVQYNIATGDKKTCKREFGLRLHRRDLDGRKQGHQMGGQWL